MRSVPRGRPLPSTGVSCSHLAWHAALADLKQTMGVFAEPHGTSSGSWTGSSDGDVGTVWINCGLPDHARATCEGGVGGRVRQYAFESWQSLLRAYVHDGNSARRALEDGECGGWPGGARAQFVLERRLRLRRQVGVGDAVERGYAVGRHS